MARKMIKKEKNSSVARVDVAFCGLLRMPDLFKRSLEDLAQMKKEGIVDRIIFSTDKGQVQKNPEIESLLKKMEVILLESDDPKEKGAGNIWFQMKDLDAALKSVPEDKFVLKTRTDAYINPGFLRKIFSSPEIFKIRKDLPNGNIFSNRVWIIWYEITRPFFMADECFYGKCKDLKLLVNYNTCYDTDFTLGPGTAHVRRFIDPFMKEYPILESSLSKSSKDAKFRKMVQTFTENVIDLRNLKLLRKIYESRRFTSLRKRTKDPEYVRALATYYSIVYSHFYVDGRSFPDQIIFRESSLPGNKLDSKKIENNFSKEKSRFPYGGQIYDYDEDLVTNICERKLEKTEFSERLMREIEKFNGEK